MTGSTANLSFDLTAGPIRPSEDSHIHTGMLPYPYHYPELGQVMVDTKF